MQPAAAMGVVSVGGSVAISVALDALLLSDVATAPAEIVVATILFNATVILLSGVGSVIEWRRPGHAIGRLLMLSGPLYALLGLSWLTSEVLEPLVEPRVYQLLFWASSTLSWPGVAIIVGWIPLLFPTGALPGPRWRLPGIGMAATFGISLGVLAAVSFPPSDGSEPVSPAPLVTLVALEVLALMWLGAAAVVTRHRRGDQVERVQIRWLGAAVALCVTGFAGTAIESGIRADDEPLLMTLVLYAGILAMPIAIGVAVTRYRLYEIDRLISRGLAWVVLSAILLIVYAGAILVLQAVFGDVTRGNTFVVAASTLLAAALFQPLRRRVQRAMDRRFDRARYDGEGVANAFSARLRGQVDLAGLEADLRQTVGFALRPDSTAVWIRNVRLATPTEVS